MVRMAQGKKVVAADDDDPLDVDAYNTSLNKSVNLGGAGQGGGFSAAAAIQKYNEDAYKNWDQNILEPCPHCNRTFLPERIHYHLKACTADRPLKPPLKRKTGNEDPEEEKESAPKLGLAAR